ncbi:hypothetical protein PsorP6_011264 [Peronosclerospora sorghi]|uniref:Uncharacterized protein n=1 Tax=Peronosclerospora sorghi TaxID=230839 RepID=A0ACC0WIB4_9STRA|nr:hypothetical protein PsorP6_011264 [Peronosclerospora sorghi]
MIVTLYRFTFHVRVHEYQNILEAKSPQAFFIVDELNTNCDAIMDGVITVKYKDEYSRNDFRSLHEKFGFTRLQDLQRSHKLTLRTCPSSPAPRFLCRPLFFRWHRESCCRPVFSPSRLDRPCRSSFGTATTSENPSDQLTASRRTNLADAPAEGLRSVLYDDAEDPALPAVVTSPSSLLMPPPPPLTTLRVPSSAIVPPRRQATSPPSSSPDGFNDEDDEMSPPPFACDEPDADEAIDTICHYGKRRVESHGKTWSRGSDRNVVKSVALLLLCHIEDRPFGTPAIAAGVALQLATPGHMQWVVSRAMELQWNFPQIEVSSAPQGHLVKFVGKVKNRATAESLLPSQAGNCRHLCQSLALFPFFNCNLALTCLRPPPLHRNRVRQSKAGAATSLSMASTDDSICSGSPLAPTSISFSSLSLMCLPKLSLTRARSLLVMEPFPSLSK